jgi:hypothetical protein
MDQSFGLTENWNGIHHIAEHLVVSVHGLAIGFRNLKMTGNLKNDIKRENYLKRIAITRTLRMKMIFNQPNNFSRLCLGCDLSATLICTESILI